MADDPWQALDEELARWRESGRVASLWWRDDDATRPRAALRRLLALSTRHAVPVAIAVVPATMEDTLVPLLADCPHATVLQHGYAHVDYAARDEPGAELGGHRPGAQVLAELAAGFGVLSSRFHDRFMPVLVPPWNRIEASLVPQLGGLGFRGLSCFAPREQARTEQGVVCSHCHVDPVNWRAGGVFRGEARCLGALIGHLRERRLGAVDPDEPTGLLTHHWSHDEALWGFLDALFERLDGTVGARWLSAAEVFAA